MSERLADLGDREAVIPWRRAMIFALTRPVTDPNYMPVTRDLSAPKLAAIVRWLEQSSEQRPTAPASDEWTDGLLSPDPWGEGAAAFNRRVVARQAARRRGEHES
jgi:hypothetical protein